MQQSTSFDTYSISYGNNKKLLINALLDWPYINKLPGWDVSKINGTTNRHTIYVNCMITLNKFKTSLMGFVHLSGREPQHPENRDQMGRGLFHIRIWTLESLAFLCTGVVNYRDRYRPVYCFVSSQVGFQTQSHRACFKKGI